MLHAVLSAADMANLSYLTRLLLIFGNVKRHPARETSLAPAIAASPIKMRDQPS